MFGNQESYMKDNGRWIKLKVKVAYGIVMETCITVY